MYIIKITGASLQEVLCTRNQFTKKKKRNKREKKEKKKKIYKL